MKRLLFGLTLLASMASFADGSTSTCANEIETLVDAAKELGSQKARIDIADKLQPEVLNFLHYRYENLSLQLDHVQTDIIETRPELKSFSAGLTREAFINGYSLISKENSNDSALNAQKEKALLGCKDLQ